MTFGPRWFGAHFGCNRVRGGYSIATGRFTPTKLSATPMGCPNLEPQAQEPLMTLKESAIDMLPARPEVHRSGPIRLTLSSAAGRIDRQRTF